MNRRGSISVVSVLIIMLVSIIGIFSIPVLRNLQEKVFDNSYASNADGVIKGAKSKYGADITNITKDGILEYTVQELLNEGYLKENEIDQNIDKNSKVLVIIKNGYVTYKYVNGTTLINKIISGMQFIDNEYYFTSDNVNNYISFNEDIYRIIKISSDDNIVIIKDDYDKELSKNDIEDYLKIVKNDKLQSKYKNIVNKIEILDSKTYANTLKDNKSYLSKNYDFWINDNNEYKIFNSLSNSFIESDTAYAAFTLKIDYSILFESGDGSRVNPYIISE